MHRSYNHISYALVSLIIHVVVSRHSNARLNESGARVAPGKKERKVIDSTSQIRVAREGDVLQIYVDTKCRAEFLKIKIFRNFLYCNAFLHQAIGNA